MGPIDNFFARNGMVIPPKKKSFYQKYKGIIRLLIILGVIVVILVFGIPIFLSK